MIVSKKSLDAIVFFEVSSINYYNKFLQAPTWPKGQSGVTIGIGYDCGYNTKEDIEKDWGKYLSNEIIIQIKSIAGLKGIPAGNALDQIKDIQIPFDIAEKVFSYTSMPKFSDLAIKSYPELSELMPDACGGILSLVYNRGNSLKDSPTDTTQRRKEMAAIKPLIANKDYDAIADQIISMKRLWPGIGGLLARRDKEASLVRNAIREYLQEELIEIQ